jgi:hypothetical protein
MNLTYAETIDADPPITIKIYTDPDPEAPDNTESDIFIITTRNRHFERPSWAQVEQYTQESQ